MIVMVVAKMIIKEQFHDPLISILVWKLIDFLILDPRSR